MEWNKDMDAAPRDGTPILTWTDIAGFHDEYCVMYWDFGSWNALGIHDLRPTHWCHLPKKPNDI